MPGRASREKGYKFEREIVKLFTAHGFEAKRAWGSNGEAIGKDPECDVVVTDQFGDEWDFQLKRRKKLVNDIRIYGNTHATIFREDRAPALILLPLDLFIGLLENRR